MQTEAWLLVLLSKHSLERRGKNTHALRICWTTIQKQCLLNKGVGRKNHSYKLLDNFCKKKVEIIRSNIGTEPFTPR